MMVIWPPQSRARPSGAHESPLPRRLTTALATAIADTTAKASRKDPCSPETPLMSGAAKAPVVRLAVHAASTRARAWGSGAAAVRSAREDGKRAAAPRPEVACPINSGVALCAVAASVQPRAISAAPPTSILLRPKRSPTTPKVSPRVAVGRKNAAETHTSWEPSSLRLCCIKPLSEAGSTRPICATHTARQQAIKVPLVRVCGVGWGS